MLTIRLLLISLFLCFCATCWARVWRCVVNTATRLESLACGLVLSIFWCIAISQSTRVFLPSSMQFLVFLTTSSFFAALAGGGIGERLPRRIYVCACLGLVAALPGLLRFWSDHSSVARSARNVFIDIPFFEVLSRSVYSFGNTDSYLVAGQGVRYHWLSFAWIGAVDSWFHTEPFDVLVMVAPVVALISAGLMAACITLRFSTSAVATFLSVVLTVCSTGFFRDGIGYLVPPTSPSHGLSVSWLLFTVFILLRLDDFVIPRRMVAAGVAFSSFMTTGGKVSHGLVLVGAVVVLTLGQVAERRFSRSSSVVPLSVCVGVLASYCLLIAGAGSGGVDFGPGSISALPVFLLPVWVIARVAGWFARIAPVGLLATKLTGRLPRDVQLMILGSLLAGTGAFFMTNHIGGSHVFFLLSATSVVVPFVPIGLSDRVGRFPRRFNMRILGASVVVVAAHQMWTVTKPADFSSLAQQFNISDQQIRDNVTGLVVLGTIILVALLIQLVRNHSGPRRGADTVVIVLWVGVLTACMSGFVSESRMLIQHMQLDKELSGSLDSADPDHQWSPSHAQAAEWLRYTDGPENELVLTNRFCVAEDARPPECGGPWGAAYFWVGAVSGKQMFIEGYEYLFGVQDDEVPRWAESRIGNSRSFAMRPDRRLHTLLWGEGVRWVWLDLKQPSAKDWGGFGTIKFENDAVRVVRLEPPTA